MCDSTALTARLDLLHRPCQDGCGDEESTGCCLCGELIVPDNANVITASNGERMLNHEEFLPWFAEDGWRMAACGWSTPASAFMTVGGCSLICTQFLRACCPSDSFRLPRSSNKTATACFGAGVTIFWICSIYLTKALPSILGRTPSSSLCSVGAEKTADKGPLELIGLRDSGKPQRLSEAAVKVRTTIEPTNALVLTQQLLLFRKSTAGTSPCGQYVARHLFGHECMVY